MQSGCRLGELKRLFAWMSECVCVCRLKDSKNLLSTYASSNSPLFHNTNSFQLRNFLVRINLPRGRTGDFAGHVDAQRPRGWNFIGIILTWNLL
jgi:hypothetical protein